MIQPGTLELIAHRWVPFKPFEIEFQGIDLTGASFAMQVRQTRDAAGSAMIGLATTVSPAEGISVSVATVDGLPVSTIQIRINEATMEALPYSRPARGGDLNLFWDMHITPSGGTKAVYFEGPFTVKGGGTQ